MFQWDLEGPYIDDAVHLVTNICSRRIWYTVKLPRCNSVLCSGSYSYSSPLFQPRLEYLVSLGTKMTSSRLDVILPPFCNWFDSRDRYVFAGQPSAHLSHQFQDVEVVEAHVHFSCVQVVVCIRLVSYVKILQNIDIFLL